MANIHGIEVSGETYDLEDTTARNGVQANTSSIGDIEAVVPSSASSSNKLATWSDVPDISQLETDVENIEAVIPSGASSSNKLIEQSYIKKFVRFITNNEAHVLLNSARDWGVTSSKAILTIKDTSGNTIWEGIAQWTGNSLGNILNRNFTRYCGTATITASNDGGSIVLSNSAASITLDYIGEHD